MIIPCIKILTSIVCFQFSYFFRWLLIWQPLNYFSTFALLQNWYIVLFCEGKPIFCRYFSDKEVPIFLFCWTSASLDALEILYMTFSIRHNDLIPTILYPGHTTVCDHKKRVSHQMVLRGHQCPSDHFGRKEVAATALKTSFQRKWSAGGQRPYLWLQWGHVWLGSLIQNGCKVLLSCLNNQMWWQNQ